MIKKEINYLTLPDFSNKYLFVNFNQRIKLSDKLNIYFNIRDNKHLGAAMKSIYLLESIFPRKAFSIKIIIKKKKTYFGQKKSQDAIFKFGLIMTGEEFIDFYRFFCFSPFSLKRKKVVDSLFVNRKLKMFDFSMNMFVSSVNLTNSFFFIKNYHLN